MAAVQQFTVEEHEHYYHRPQRLPEREGTFALPGVFLNRIFTVGP